jgi:hypothetical protein
MSSDQTTNLVCEQYPFKKIRNDMTNTELLAYTNDWKTFDTVWSYNYNVRASGKNTGYYIFRDNAERISYNSGQAAHVSIYPIAAAAGVFNNIP